MDQQQVIFTIVQDGADHNLKVTFEPGLSGPNSEEYKNMSEDDKQMQNFAGHVASEVLNALRNGDD